MKAKPYLTAEEAASELGISVPTLYAYVSRGLLRSETADRSRRTRRYHAEDVQRLKERQEQRRDPDKVIDSALHWGTPMLDSAITLIDQGCLYYRGQDALRLAQEETVERVAALIWTGEREQAESLFASDSNVLPARWQELRRLLRDYTALERFQMVLPTSASAEPGAYDLRPNAVAQTGARLLRLLTDLAVDRHAEEGTETGECPERAGGRAPGTEGRVEKLIQYPNRGIAAALQRAWRPEEEGAAPLLQAALILCADHELNISSFTARCVASAGSPPHAVLNAGLAALQGSKHGGATARVAALCREAGRPENAVAVLGDRIRRGEEIPGFGHRLYPNGDPRGRLLLDWTARAYPTAPAVALAQALEEATQRILEEAPNLDFGLVTLCSALDLPTDAPLTLFALGRTIGWIGHAIEEYQLNRLIRPRAHYTGLLPPT